IEIVVVGIDHDRAGRFPAVIVDNGAAERLGDRRVGVTNLRQQLLVVRLEVGGVGRLIGGGLHAAWQHPSSRQDSEFYSQRHDLFPVKAYVSGEPPAFAASIIRSRRHDSVKPIIVDLWHNSSTETPVPRRGRPPVAFLQHGWHRLAHSRTGNPAHAYLVSRCRLLAATNPNRWLRGTLVGPRLVPTIRSSCLTRGTHLHELRKAMGTRKHIDSSAAFLFEVPG